MGSISDDAPTTLLSMTGGSAATAQSTSIMRFVVDLMTLGKRNEHHEHTHNYYEYPRHERLPA